ncbi:hypothetical protein HYH02_014140 [Chlamydomonas schloesseri]|uniref:tRNA/rRNA methyltransferase SpoU type domain-containing protein n=1 Tax=Chlamydomonas schloesseri TaxID=2026947 RepID=A0A835VTW2_9CHLO|nr:hypothetical protein HYH02_014140 [Chlamydomonas schloesseri]|eukprot:KAG2429102.1 hypothetical protein HYH02_014140 [Chlamydomonas schloesseri]
MHATHVTCHHRPALCNRWRPTATQCPYLRPGYRLQVRSCAVPNPGAREFLANNNSSSSSSSSSSGLAVVSGSGFITRQAWHRPDVAVVLVHPQIPQNTGNVARSCAATGTPLHLVAPLGFELDDKKLKRAGLDYWDNVAVAVHRSWDHFFSAFRSLPGPKRLVAFTVYGDTYYGAPEFTYQSGDWLVFGAETSGLPPQAHEDVLASGGSLVKIPIRDTHVRSINLAVAAGIGLFEAIRQLDAAGSNGHEVAPRVSPTLQEVASMHDNGRPIGAKSGSPGTIDQE